MSFMSVSIITGCIPGIKKTELNTVLGSSTNIFRVLPGYTKRKIRNLDYHIEMKQKELRLFELRLERKVLKLKYDKLL